MRRKGWLVDEEKLLIQYYKTHTIAELISMFKQLGRNRNQDSINAKIKRLKSEGRIKGGKDTSTIQRSLSQRNLLK